MLCVEFAVPRCQTDTSEAILAATTELLQAILPPTTSRSRCREHHFQVTPDLKSEYPLEPPDSWAGTERRSRRHRDDVVTGLSAAIRVPVPCEHRQDGGADQKHIYCTSEGPPEDR